MIVTENMFGDILTDEASVISGSLGMLPSASVGSEVALFEPIHGSYPQAAGKNIANPMATILSAAMLLEHLGLDTEGSAVRAAVDRALTEGVVTEDLAAQGERRYSTSEVGDFYPQKRGCNRKGCNPFFRAGHEAHPARTATPRPGSRFISRPRIARVPPGRPP